MWPRFRGSLRQCWKILLFLFYFFYLNMGEVSSQLLWFLLWNISSSSAVTRPNGSRFTPVKSRIDFHPDGTSCGTVCVPDMQDGKYNTAALFSVGTQGPPSVSQHEAGHSFLQLSACLPNTNPAFVSVHRSNAIDFFFKGFYNIYKRITKWVVQRT